MSDVSLEINVVGKGIPGGGTDGQVLTKDGGEPQWRTPVKAINGAGPDAEGNVTLELPEGLPDGAAAHMQLATDADGNAVWEKKLSAVSELENDAGYVTADEANELIGTAMAEITIPASEDAGTPEQTIALDDAMTVGRVDQVGRVDTTDTGYMYTEQIVLNEAKTFQLIGTNLKGVTLHPALRYVTAYDADGNVLSAYSQQSLAEASLSVGRTVTMDAAVHSVIITIYKAFNYTDKTVILPAVEGEGETHTTLQTDKLAGFTGELLPDDVRYGIYRGGVADYSDKRYICTRGYVPPFVTKIAAISADYQLAVVVYSNGAYVKTVAWITNGNSYTFDHSAYQYKLYIARADLAYMNTFDAARKSVTLTLSSADVLYSWHKLKAQMDVQRETMRDAMEYMMRRNYSLAYANAPAPNGLISYVGNNQIVHPKVLYFADKFGGHRYWMAYTPYPWAVDDYENPCIAYSDDGYEWTNIDGNPLDDPAGDGYNSDTHLVYIESTGTLEVWYRYVGDYETTPVPEIIYRQTSTDGINWTEKEVVINNNSGDYVQYLSPCILHDGSVYKIWVVNGSDRAIHYYESADLSSIDEVRIIDLDYVDGDDTFHLWHIDVIEDDGKTVLLGMAKTSASTTADQIWSLFIATSEDNEVFTTPAVVMVGNPYGWDKQLYRSSIVNVDGEYRIYYTAQDEKQRHGLGVSTSSKLGEFVGRIF